MLAYRKPKGDQPVWGTPILRNNHTLDTLSPARLRTSQCRPGLAQVPGLPQQGDFGDQSGRRQGPNLSRRVDKPIGQRGPSSCWTESLALKPKNTSEAKCTKTSGSPISRTGTKPPNVPFMGSESRVCSRQELAQTTTRLQNPGA